MTMFKEDMVYVCGEFRKYKDMPKKQTRDYQKEVDKVISSYNPIVQESEQLLEKQQAKQEELDDVNEWLGILKEEENRDLKEIKKQMKLRNTIRNELREINQEIIEFNNAQEEKMNELNDEIPRRLAILASQMIEITPEEYLEKATETDELFMRYVSIFKQMYDARKTIPEMEAQWAKIIDNNINSRLNINPS